MIEIRQMLYERTSLTPLFNPTGEVDPEELPSPLVIDLTMSRNELLAMAVKEEPIAHLLKEADAVVTETESMATFVRRTFKTRTAVVCPFGWSTAKDKGAPLRYGALNSTSTQKIGNAQRDNLKLLTKLPKNTTFVVFGDRLQGVDESTEQSETDDLTAFLADVDILLMPAAMKMDVELSIPISALMARTVILTTAEYITLNQCTAVLIQQDRNLTTWRKALADVESKIGVLDRLKNFAESWAKQVSGESVERVIKLERYLKTR